MSSKSVATPPLLSLQQLEKGYFEAGQRHAVLSRVDLDLPRGAFAALLGRSGAGKSTLLNLISGIDTPDSGKVLIGGTVVSELDETARTNFRRLHIGFVFQAFNLIPTLTVMENVRLPLALARVPKTEAQDRAVDYLDRVGLADRAGAFPDRLSGGEQQRVAIVRALVHQPDLLLADEPTGNLDYDTGRSIMDLLHGLVREMGVTMLVVTHDRAFLRASDRILALREGALTQVSFDSVRDV